MLLSLCVFAAVIVTARGFSREAPIDAVKEESPNELEAQLKNFEDNDDPKNISNPHDCDCDGVCDALHYSRLPKAVRVSKISFETFHMFFEVQVKYEQICTDMQYLQKYL